MKANVYFLQQILEGTIQYVIPYFQRNYSWEKEEWEQLWQDIEESREVQTTHFFGPIVTRQIISSLGDVRRNQIIDGQQRITTLFIIFALMRNKAIENGDIDLAEDIHELYLINKRQKEGYLKLLPSKIDRKIFKDLIDIEKPFRENYLQYKSLLRSENKESKIIDAYNFFSKKLEKCDNETLKKIKTIIITKLYVTSQELDNNDDPYKIYAGLNAKGRQLTKADLIRNYFFECIPDEGEQDKVYDELWMPMEVVIKEQLKEDDKEEGFKEYIKHYLIYRQGSLVKEGDIYSILRHNVDQNNIVLYLKELFNYSHYYKRLLRPELEPDIDIRKRLNRLNDINVTTVYPLLLYFYGYYTEKKINGENFIDILDTIINYLIRRYVCDIPSNSLNGIFSSIISQLKEYEDNLTLGLKILLQSKDYPKDDEFKAKFKELNYVAGVRGKKIKTILEVIEDYYGLGRKEIVFCDNTQIEHIMPQTPTEQWKQDMGDEWKNTHEQYLHNIGNLTLTGYNTDLSNKDFLTKKGQLGLKSRFELNKYFSHVEKWNKEEIEKRANILSDNAIEVWPYFGIQVTTKIKSEPLSNVVLQPIQILQKEPVKIPTTAQVEMPTMASVHMPTTAQVETPIKSEQPIQILQEELVKVLETEPVKTSTMVIAATERISKISQDQKMFILDHMSKNQIGLHTRGFGEYDFKNVIYILGKRDGNTLEDKEIVIVIDVSYDTWVCQLGTIHETSQINGATDIINQHKINGCLWSKLGNRPIVKDDIKGTCVIYGIGKYSIVLVDYEFKWKQMNKQK